MQPQPLCSDSKLDESVDLLESRKVLQRDLDRLDWWAKAIIWSSTVTSCIAVGLGAEWLENGSVEKGPGVQMLEHVKRRTMKLLKCLQHKFYKEKLRELGLLTLENLIALYCYLKGVVFSWIQSLLPGNRWYKRKWPQVTLRGGLDQILGNFFTENVVQH